MADYPDWTTLMHLIGADIMMPIDIQGSYIMIPVDIQAQYVTLDIDIVAQTVGNLTVDIAAASVGDINVDINAQSIGDITIDIDAQSIGIQLKPDWETPEGNDKNLSGYDTVGDSSPTYVLDYTVPTGKTFYIYQWGFNITSDNGVWAALQYKHNATYTTLFASGGRVGGSQSFAKPMAIVAGDHIIVQLRQYSGGDVTGFASVGGYEA